MAATLHVVFQAACEILGGPGGGKFEKVGLALDGSGLCIAAGHNKRVSLHSLASIKKVHARFRGWQAPFEVASGRGALRQISSHAQTLRISKASLRPSIPLRSSHVRGDSRRCHRRTAWPCCKRYPEQINRQLAALRAAAEGADIPQPAKGHTHVMLTIDAGGLSPAQGGQGAVRAGEAGLWAGVEREAGDGEHADVRGGGEGLGHKETHLSMRVHQCIHHRWSSSLFLDVDLSASVDPTAYRHACVKRLCAGDESRVSASVLAHGSIKEKLALGLVVHLRSGILQPSGDFGTRLELRWADVDPSTEPLGRCDVRFWEEGTRSAAPTCVLFEMHKESCRAWSIVHGDKKVSVLAASLVSRLEVFCLRLAAPRRHAARTRLLVLGWERTSMPSSFQAGPPRRPRRSLGFKMLKSERRVPRRSPQRRRPRGSRRRRPRQRRGDEAGEGGRAKARRRAKGACSVSGKRKRLGLRASSWTRRAAAARLPCVRPPRPPRLPAARARRGLKWGGVGWSHGASSMRAALPECQSTADARAGPPSRRQRSGARSLR